MAKITFQPRGKVVQARAGQTLLSLSRAARVIIPQRCDGQASCLMCKVKIERGSVTPVSEVEERKLSEKELAQGLRLACQTKVTNQDCVVRIPESRFKSVVQAALERQRQEEEEGFF
ncbi:2Fe-2S iron-sulfur cluster-binding protein [Brevibacillus dissolubilis]|uniref:2Fe-2S iron-sulfur cluster-binding protein n=1 Tax=Brevibacillus dissolubilis TaxID=1844116 RepID=UPI001116ECB1|nr:2Fe-2S iron-sulfur cluster-binding protein [Brevibacillus dissolubilis]